MSHSIDEAYSVYHEQEQVARKRHECCACDLPIEAGHKYTRAYVVFNSKRESFKRCARCQLIHEHLRTLAPGEMWPDERLACGTLYSDEWGPEPAWLTDLAFWRPGERLPATNACEPHQHALIPVVDCHSRWGASGYQIHACRRGLMSPTSGNGTEVCS